MRTLLFIALTVVGCSDNIKVHELPSELEKIWFMCEGLDSSLTSVQVENYHNKKWKKLYQEQIKFIGKVNDVQSFMSDYLVWLNNPFDIEALTKLIVVRIKSKKIADSLRKNDIVLVSGEFGTGIDNCGTLHIDATSIELYKQK